MHSLRAAAIPCLDLVPVNRLHPLQVSTRCVKSTHFIHPRGYVPTVRDVLAHPYVPTVRRRRVAPAESARRVTRTFTYIGQADGAARKY